MLEWRPWGQFTSYLYVMRTCTLTTTWDQQYSIYQPPQTNNVQTNTKIPVHNSYLYTHCDKQQLSQNLATICSNCKCTQKVWFGLVCWKCSQAVKEVPLAWFLSCCLFVSGHCGLFCGSSLRQACVLNLNPFPPALNTSQWLLVCLGQVLVCLFA